MVTDSYFVPGSDPSCLTLAQAKSQLKIEAAFTQDDVLIQEYIDSAQSDCENFIGRVIGRRKFVLELNEFETVVTFQANYENDAIEKIEYYAPGSTEVVVMDADGYKLRKSTITGCLDIKFLTLPETDKRNDAVTVTINQGWEPSKVPAPIKQAMKLLISDAYERREDRGEIGYNSAANSKLRPYKLY